jgi:hypothetical protein
MTAITAGDNITRQRQTATRFLGAGWIAWAAAPNN